MIPIRICTEDDIPKLQKFIDEKWRAGHILSYDTTLLKWQHLKKNTNHLNYIIAEREEDKQIIAIFGYINTGQFDESLDQQKDFWLAIWKIDTDIAPPGIGTLLLRFFVDTYQPNSIGAIGINDRIEKFYKFLGYKPGVLNHYYYLNPNIKEFRIADIKAVPLMENKKVLNNQTLEELITVTEIPSNNNRPVKTLEYLKNRYLTHPKYKYRCFAIKDNGDAIALLVIRKVSVNEASCLRIVDILGDISKINNLKQCFNDLLEKENSEYIDCLNGGLSEDVFYNIGFRKRDDSLIIPNYFEPFERKNVDIKYCYKSNYEPYIMFKGDSDQDRPNM
jgi:hypothetical protein